MKIVSTNLGERKEIDWKGKIITTGIYKFSVAKPIFLDKEKIKDDAICDKESHGGTLQAVYAYSEKHYKYWKELYPNLDWQYGMFGENLTVDDLYENKLHVGNVYKVGETILEVTKPREPCMKLGIRFNNMKIVKQFWQQDFSGVYFKVLQTGRVKVGDEFIQIESCLENQTITEVYQNKRLENGIKLKVN